jgi:hypothetical protein
MITHGDFLYIFTKNWLNQETNIYKLSKQAGNYSINQIDTFNTNCLITDADYNPVTQQLVLLGYNNTGVYINILSGFSFDYFSSATIDLHLLIIPSGHATQTEGICFINNTQCYISSESNSSNQACLYSLDLTNLLNFTQEDIPVMIYPNPSSNLITVNFNFSELSIFNSQGKLQQTGNKHIIDISKLNKGVYFITFFDKNKQIIHKKYRFIKN